MKRRLFIATVASVTVIPINARAQMAVFDATNFAKIVQMLADTGAISTMTARTAEQTLNLYVQAVRSGTIDVNQLWTLAQPEINKIIANASVGPTLALDAQNVQTQFHQAYPAYSPDQPYDNLYAIWRQSQTNATIGALKIAQATIQSAQNNATTRDQIMAQPAQNRDGILKASQQLAAVQSHQLQDLTQLMAAQIQNQGNYYAAVMASDERTRSSHGAALLDATFRQVPGQLRGASTAPLPTPAPLPTSS